LNDDDLTVLRTANVLFLHVDKTTENQYQALRCLYESIHNVYDSLYDSPDSEDLRVLLKQWHNKWKDYIRNEKSFPIENVNITRVYTCGMYD